MLIVVFLLMYFLIGSLLAIYGLKIGQVLKDDRDMVWFLIILWPFAVFVLLGEAFIDLIMKIGKPKEDS